MARGNPRPHGRADRLCGNRRTLAFAAAGLATGAAIKVLDVSTSNAANVFSQLTVWVLVCTAIAVLSESPRHASLNVFLFCAGMLSAYYLAAEALGASYSLAFAMGWLALSLLSPLFARLVWAARAPAPSRGSSGLAWSPPCSPRRSSSSNGLGLGTSLPAPRRPPSSSAAPAELDDDRPAAGRADVRPAEAIRRGLSCARFER